MVSRFRRYLQIARILEKYGLGILVERRRYKRHPEIEETTYVRIRLAIEELGPTFIKFGQILSTRTELFPPELIDQLKLLQDRLPPIPFSVLRPTVAEYCRNFDECFLRVDEIPLAAASLAQVHRAVLKDGTEVVLKIQRPGIRDLIETDISILRSLARRVERLFPEWRVYNPTGLVEEFAEQIRKELDFVRDGKNGERLAYNFRDWEGVKFPKMYWEHSGRDLLVMEYIDGVRIDDVVTIRQMGINPTDIANRGFAAYMKQIFEDGFFHGDPHAGNLLVTPRGDIAFLDFGIVGILRPEKREVYIDLLRSLEENDVNLLVATLRSLGAHIKEEDEDPLKDDLYIMLNDYAITKIREYNFSATIETFTGILRRYRLKVPMNLMLMLKVIMEVSTVGVTLDPDFNFTAHAMVYLEETSRGVTPGRVVKDTSIALADAFIRVIELPAKLEKALQKVSSGKSELEVRDLDRVRLALYRSTDRLVLALIIAAVVIGSSIVLLSSLTLPVYVVYFAFIVYIIAVILGFYALYDAISSRRERQ
ncbi:MAG TPA: AarF/ABC1/UbiB kinase family protein [Methanomicrobiales archaeon]|nr:AarF/ABC1/UbiB kinase family protein [Methanomicrobiales archaeon]